MESVLRVKVNKTHCELSSLSCCIKVRSEIEQLKIQHKYPNNIKLNSLIFSIFFENCEWTT